MSDVLDPVQRKLISRILMHVRQQSSPDGPIAVLSPLLLTADEVSRVADLYPCHVATEAERQKLGDLYSMHEDSRMLREAFPRFLDLMERVTLILEADRLRTQDDPPSGLHLARPPARPPSIDMPTPSTPDDPPARIARRRPKEREPIGERLLTLVETYPRLTVGALVLVVAIVYGVVPQLVELVREAGPLAVDAMPIPDAFLQDIAP